MDRNEDLENGKSCPLPLAAHRPNPIPTSPNATSLSPSSALTTTSARSSPIQMRPRRSRITHTRHMSIIIPPPPKRLSFVISPSALGNHHLAPRSTGHTENDDDNGKKGRNHLRSGDRPQKPFRSPFKLSGIIRTPLIERRSKSDLSERKDNHEQVWKTQDVYVDCEALGSGLMLIGEEDGRDLRERGRIATIIVVPAVVLLGFIMFYLTLFAPYNLRTELASRFDYIRQDLSTGGNRLAILHEWKAPTAEEVQALLNA